MEVVDVVYDTQKGTVTPSLPQQLRSLRVDNRDSSQAQDSSSEVFTEGVTNTSHFEEGIGMTVSVGVTISGKCPFSCLDWPRF